MAAIPDCERERLDKMGKLAKFQYTRPDTNCGAGNVTTHICRQDNCHASFPLVCSVGGCLNCRVHADCKKCSLQDFKDIFKAIATASRVLSEKIVKENQTIRERLNSMDDVLIEGSYFPFLDPDNKLTLDVILRNRGENMTGEDVNALLIKMEKNKQENGIVKNTPLIKKFQEQLHKLMADIHKLNLKIIDEFHQPKMFGKNLEQIVLIQSLFKYFCLFLCFLFFFFSSIQQNIVTWNLTTVSEGLSNFNYQTNSTSPQEHLILRDSFSTRQKMYLVTLRDLGFWNSTIVGPGQVQEIRFIYLALGEPTKMELIYRASEHGFSALSFYQTCNQVPHTFVLVKNQFGKILAGYTPLPWKHAEQIQFIFDAEQKSFLLSVDLREKMAIKKHQSAIRTATNGGGFGFGQGRDLVISFDSNKNNYSEALFCYSFACKEPYSYDSRTWERLCGSQDGRFKVAEIQIYRVHMKGRIIDDDL